MPRVTSNETGAPGIGTRVTCGPDVAAPQGSIRLRPAHGAFIESPHEPSVSDLPCALGNVHRALNALKVDAPSTPEVNMVRRQLFAKLAALPLAALGALRAQAAEKKPLKIMMRSAWGSDDPTRATFVYAHALALADAGHEVQIFLTGEATYMMRKATADQIKPVGWPPMSEAREKVLAQKRIQVFS